MTPHAPYPNEHVVLYGRVSSQHQADQYGLKTQLAACQELAQRMGWTVVATYTDTISGATSTRHGLDQLREDIRTGHATAVIAYHLDRLNRDPAHHYLFVREMKAAGARIYYASKGGRPVAETDDDEFIEGIEALVAFRERSRIRTRTLDARRKKARDGKLMGNGETPYGYVRVGERGHAVWEIVEDEAAVVRLIFAWYLQGIGVYTIVRRLTEQHVPTPSEARQTRKNRKRGVAQWNSSTVYKILRNSSYIGDGRTFRQMVVGANEHGSKRYALRDPRDWHRFSCPAIIASEVWSTVQQRLSMGRQQSPRNSRYEYLMGRRIRCDECKAAIVGRPAYQGRYRYYTCGGTRTLAYTAKAECTLPNVRTERVDDACWAWVVHTLLDEANLRERTQQNGARDSAARQRIDARLRAVAQDIADLDLERARYQALYGRGRMTDAEFDAKDDEIKARRAALDQEMASLHQEQESLSRPDQLEQNLVTAATLRQKADAATFAIKRSIIDQLDVTVFLSRKDGQLWGEVVSNAFHVRDMITIDDR